MGRKESLVEKQKRWNGMVSATERFIADGWAKRLETRDKSIPELNEFFAGRKVLVTGGTGFLGKALIEKLLRSVPQVDKIYVIIRPRRNHSPAQRMETILSGDLYDLVRKQNPDCFRKVIAIPGDVSHKGLGLSPEDTGLLQREVSVVFHGAATVRFDDPLKSAILLNLRGTHEIIELSKGMPNLKSFVHISTTYCNTNQSLTMEKVYPTPYNWRHVIKIAETTSTSDLQALVKKVIGFQPNTYTFTKQLSEKVVDDARDQVPVTIIRPSVVTFATAEPLPGWSDNINGPIGFSMGIIKGIVRGFYIDADINLKSVPVDNFTKILIGTAWLRGTDQRLSADSHEIDVQNVSMETLCDGTYGDMFSCIPRITSAVRPASIRAPRIYATKSIFYYYFKLYTSHILFAMSADMLLRIFGQKAMVMKLTRTIHNVNMALVYFLFQNFHNETQNTYKSVMYTTHPDFRHSLQFDYVEEAIKGSDYAYKHVLKEKEAGPYRQIMVETIHFIQHAFQKALFAWLGWKFVLQRFI